jgi:choline dehydrogenase-like flavoprotein
VGAGAAGITIAHELRTAPLRVAVLESGGLSPDDVTQSLYTGASTAQPYYPLADPMTRTRCFGGTTHVWTGECRPLDELDFERRDWVPDSGWPLTRADLLPFYERAHVRCELGRFAYDAADWAHDGVGPIALDPERVRSSVFHYSPPTRFGEVYRGDLERSTNVTVFLNANAIDLETPAPAERVRAVRVACLSGSGFRVRARAFVLAAGGIENARLLLLSNTVQTAGLGNGHDVVGRYFMEHLYLDRAASILARRDRISDLYTRGHDGDGRLIRGILGLAPVVQRRERLTNYCAVLEDDSLRTAIRAVAIALRHGRLHSRGVAGYVRNTLGYARSMAAARLRPTRPASRHRLYLVKNVMEQVPNVESRVVLSDEKDRLGCRRAELRWRLSALDKHTVHRAHALLEEELRRSGVGRLMSAMGAEADPWPSRLRGARHHMGTTRMHPDPRRGVVDADGRVHGVGNLYVAGSSVFPTSGAANPTLTIVALAIRLAEHLERTR